MLLSKAIIALSGFQLFMFETTLALPLETKQTNVLSSNSVNTAFTTTRILTPRSSGFIDGYILGSLGNVFHDPGKKKEKKLSGKTKETLEQYCEKRDYWMEEPYADCIQSKR